MSKFKLLVLVMAVLFILPVSALATDAELVTSGGAVDPDTAGALICENPQCQQVIDIENEYLSRRLELLQEIENETDPWEREALQKEIQKVKFMEELALKELYLEISLAGGDTERAAELQKALDALYKPTGARPALAEPQQNPDEEIIRPVTPVKNPDDA